MFYFGKYKIVTNFGTNLENILLTSKINISKMNEMGITSYYKDLHHGEKDVFIREVAEAIGQSSSSIRRKIKDGGWSLLEIREIEKIIVGR